MDSTHALLPTQNRVEDPVGCKLKAGAAGEGNNRRALIDVTNRGAENVCHRPATRSFCAQMNAKEEEKVNENNVIVVRERQPGPLGKAIAQKRVSLKPKPEVIIEISPDTKEEKSRQTRDGSSKKKVHTLTSIIAARSKAACGITTNKPKDHVVNIDAPDANNQLAAVEYVEDIYKYYKLTENSTRAEDYMYTQSEINEKMRGILLDWLVEVHNKFELMPETLYLTIHIVDQYLSLKSVPRKSLQLVGITAMLIASKYEEIWAAEVNDFISISDNAYSREQILTMEKSILGKLEWSLTVPTPYVFLVRYIKAAQSDQEMENMVFFLAEVGLMQYELISYCPSMIAASAVYAARCTLRKSPLWDETLKRYTGFAESQLLDCAKLLVCFHSMGTQTKLQAVHKKYSKPIHFGVALCQPAKELLG